MKRALFSLLVLVGCKKSSSEATPEGYVIRVHLEKRLPPSDVGGIEVVLSKDSGFPAFSPERMAGQIRVESRDTNGDAANEVVLTWPADFDFAETQFVRLRFDNQAAFAMTIAGSASNTSGGTLATGSETVTVPAGGVDAVDVTLACAAKGCVPIIPDAGPDGPGDGGPDGGPDSGPTPEPQPDVQVDQIPDAGPMPEPPPDLSTADTTLTQVGETASAAGTSGAGALVLQHQVGHMIGNGSSSGGAGPTTVESVLTITR